MGSLVVIEGMTFRERRSLSGSAKISKGNSFHALTTIVSTVTDALRKNYSFDSESLCERRQLFVSAGASTCLSSDVVDLGLRVTGRDEAQKGVSFTSIY